jgi:hypothetical protein
LGRERERIQTLTSMGYAIAHGDLEKVQAITKTEHHWLLNDGISIDGEVAARCCVGLVCVR